MSDFPTLDHHWGSQVIFYGLAQLFGSWSLSFFNFLLGAIAFGMVYIYLLKKHEPAAVLMALGLFLPLLTDRIGVRPEIFSNLFIVLLIFRPRFKKLTLINRK